MTVYFCFIFTKCIFLELSYNFTGNCNIKINMHSEKVIVFGIFGLRPMSLSRAHMFIVFLKYHKICPFEAQRNLDGFSWSKHLWKVKRSIQYFLKTNTTKIKEGTTVIHDVGCESHPLQGQGTILRSIFCFTYPSIIIKYTIRIITCSIKCSRKAKNRIK